MKRVFQVLIFIFALLVFISTLPQSPEDKEKASERGAIDYCWQSYDKKSNSYGQQRFIAGACEKMEADFLTKWGVKP